MNNLHFLIPQKYILARGVQYRLWMKNSEIVWIGNKPVGGCIACKVCAKKGQCVFDDIVNEVREKAYQADGFIFGTPVHYGAASGNMTAFMDRLFYSELCGNGNKAFYMKPAAAVISARRAGTTATFDQINKCFTIQEILSYFYPETPVAKMMEIRRQYE